MRNKILKYILTKFYGVKFLDVIDYEEKYNYFTNSVLISTETRKAKAHSITYHYATHSETIITILN